MPTRPKVRKSRYVSPRPLLPECVVRLGERLMPGSVTDAWYAVHCPPAASFGVRALLRAGVPARDVAQWRLATILRGIWPIRLWRHTW